MKQRLTILSLLCALTMAAAIDFGPPVGSRFPKTSLPADSMGPKGAAILFYQAPAQLMEIEQHREAFHKLGLGVAALKDFAGHAARPGWFVLDARGAIVAKYFEEDPSQCYPSAALLVHQFGWTNPEATREVEGKQLTATLGASNSRVAPGERVAL